MKQRHRLLTFGILIVIIAAIIVFGVTLRKAVFAPGVEAEMPLPEADKVQVSAESYPVRLIIPSAHVDAAVQRVGIGKSGRMAVPSNYTDVGWYRYGPPPGGSGNAVFAGHLDNGFGLSGVFMNLHEVKTGDDVYITNGKDERLHFKVTKEETLPFDTSQTATVFAAAGRPMLKLITCEGTWDAQKKMYSDRLVVTAQYVGKSETKSK